MKNCFKVVLLFGALFLTGIDAKAATTDEYKVTDVSAWIDDWTEQMKIAAQSIGKNRCGGENIDALIESLNLKIRETPKNITNEDFSRLLGTLLLTESVLDKKFSCLVNRVEN